MSITISDLHGNLKKLQYFLEYKPEEEHIIAGDIMDSFYASDDDIINTLEMAVNSNAILLWGNHDLHYLEAAPFRCSGYRGSNRFSQHNIFTQAIEKYKSRFKVSVVRDNFIITHAGVHSNYKGTVGDLNEKFNQQWYNYLTGVKDRIDIFNISSARGGSDNSGGIFWCDYRQEKLNENINQVFGHSHDITPYVFNYDNGTIHAVVDCNEWKCFNTVERTMENFFPEDLDKEQYEVLF